MFTCFNGFRKVRDPIYETDTSCVMRILSCMKF